MLLAVDGVSHGRGSPDRTGVEVPEGLAGLCVGSGEGAATLAVEEEPASG